MSVMEIGKELVALCQQGKNLEAIEKWYHPDVVSVEACAMPEMEQTQRGIEAIKKKNMWWFANYEVHGGKLRGPFPHGDRFALWFKTDVTCKQTKQRMTLEQVALYTVENDKITKEEFFYSMEG